MFPIELHFHPYGLILAAVLGPILGTLAHRVIRRWPQGRSLWGGADRCHRCGRPFASALASRRRRLGLFAGRRRKPCGHGTDPWLPANILVFTGGAVALALSHPDGNWLSWAQAMLLFAVLVPLSVIDWQSMTVEPRLVAFGVGLHLLSVLIFQGEQFLASIGGLLIGAGFFHMLDFFYEMVRGRRGLGEGDAAVAGLVGAFVGWQGLVPVFALASVTGLIGGIAWLAVSRRGLDAPIPFVPFVSVAGMAVYLAQLHGWIVAPSSSFLIR